MCFLVLCLHMQCSMQSWEVHAAVCLLSVSLNLAVMLVLREQTIWSVLEPTFSAVLAEEPALEAELLLENGLLILR